MAVGVEEHKASPLAHEPAVAERAEPQRVAGHAADQDAPAAAHAEPAPPGSFGIRELLLALCIGLPQLAWMGFLMYLVLGALS